MKQYCRYCVYLTTGNGIWCEKRQRTYSESYAKSVNNCGDFELNVVDAFFENEKGYQPRKEKAQVDDRQITWEEYEISKGKHKGEVDIRHLTGYCWTFERCLKSFRERTLGESGATTLLELLEALRSVFEDMDAIDRTKFEADVKKLEEVSK